MKIKLQDYGLINIKMIDDMIKELEGFKTGDVLKDLPTRSLIGTLEELKQQLIPAEISDEEIKRGIKREYLFSNSEEKRLMIEGEIWYKEQLKNKL